MASNTPYVAHTDYASPANVFTTDHPKISQSPCQALCHLHHIVGNIVTVILTFWVNYGIARLVLHSVDRVGLYYKHDYVLENGVKYFYSGSTIVVDLIISVLLCGFFCSLLSHGGIGGAVQRGEAIPVPKSELRVWRFLGVTIRNIWIRSLYIAMVGFVLTYFITIAAFDRACSTGNMPTFTPVDSTSAECYMDAGKYSWFKGGLCGIVAMFIFPIIELAGLNRAHVSTEQFHAFLTKKGVPVEQANDLEVGDGLSSSVPNQYSQY